METSKKEDVQVELDVNVEAQTESCELESGPDSIAISAETSLSEGSTNFSSDGFEDEDQWNDWINERVIFKDFKEQVDDEEQDFADDDRPEDGSIVSRTDSDISDLSNEDEISAFDVPGLGFLQFHPDNEGEGKSAGLILCHYSQSLYSTSGDEELSEYEHEGEILDNFLFGRQKARKPGEARRISIRIYDTISNQQKPVFHFSVRRSKSVQLAARFSPVKAVMYRSRTILVNGSAKQTSPTRSKGTTTRAGACRGNLSSST